MTLTIPPAYSLEEFLKLPETQPFCVAGYSSRINSRYNFCLAKDVN
ncbi:hypothetical protein ACN23B_20430 [Anabaena sp. FACHB-709]|uniref:Uncharacterized protein n=1 Tax=Anabaena cylindrica FACHB-318 TaxID=2692880 RepID=A0ABR7ZLU7_ANACY|nr:MULTISPECIES: hypothetical protein [Nostocaceae]MBD2173652.1 hypothetical protein [Anabaena cylindrica FACHB-318]MBD2265470.1 hypothetical protein [Anabaena sp. FACHB-709]MBD2274606.1 hypothetical protein [Nostoc sp. PCC 7120 = FACHB-418]MBD2285754.1 hypothetical protein [Anabaena cylindrica FACHB-170]MBD2348344.1 hypothetical protein [Trichormus variabilis FACHB-171]